ncbi:MAG: type II secretion system F family protein [Rhodomicrobiaceae bacterium]
MGAELISIVDQRLAMLLAGFAAFAAITALALPSEPDPRLSERLQSVARERDRLRDKRLADLAARSKRKVRREEAGALLRLVRRVKADAPGSGASLALRMRMAGFRGPGAEALFLFFRAATPLAFCLAALAASLVLPEKAPPLAKSLSIALAAAATGYALPRLVLDRLITRRQRAILRAFPDALDLLLICVQSGMSVEAALAKVTRDIASQSIELAEELSLTMAELSYLPVRWRAYANLGERIGIPAVRLITAALVQAERHGTSISQALTSAAREGREARIAEAERKAAALPPKLAIPLVVFFLPVLLTIILAPAIMQAGDALKRNRGRLIAGETQILATHRQNVQTSLPPAQPIGRRAP